MPLQQDENYLRGPGHAPRSSRLQFVQTPGAVSWGSALGRLEENPVHLILKSATETSRFQHSQPEIPHNKAMPFQTWQLVKQFMRQKWPSDSLKTIADGSIRLYHKGVELNNNDMIGDLCVEEDSQDKPWEIHYLIISDRGEHKDDIGLYVFPTVWSHTSDSLRRTVTAADTALRRGITPQLTLEGTGATYKLFDSDKSRVIAVFKPKDEEACAPQNPRGYVGKENSVGFRQGIYSTQQAAREVAAYILDHGEFAGVPGTTLVGARHPAFVKVNGNTVWKIGAFQMFVEVKDSAGNFAAHVFSVQDVHRIGILDIRIINMDRNDGNILVRHSRGSSKYQLIPIDHGLSLPDRLEVYTDDLAWMSWPQAHKPFGEEELRYIKERNGATDAKLLKQKLEVRRECTRLMEMTTLLLQIGAEYGLTLHEIGTILYRVDDSSKDDDNGKPSKQSPFEKIIEHCVDLTLVGAGEGSSVNFATLSGLDLQRTTAPIGNKAKVASPTTVSPLSSPCFGHSLPSGDDPAAFDLDSPPATDASQSPVQTFVTPAIPDASGKLLMPNAGEEFKLELKEMHPHRQSSKSWRHRTSTRLVEREHQAQGGIFSRPKLDLRANDWPPELEKSFKAKVSEELKKYIAKNFQDRTEKESKLESDSSTCAEDKSVTTEDDDSDDDSTSLASAFSVMPSDVDRMDSSDEEEDGSPVASKRIETLSSSSSGRRMQPMMRHKMKQERGAEAMLPTVPEDTLIVEDSEFQRQTSADGGVEFSDAATPEVAPDPPRPKQRYIPPMMRKKMEEEAAAQAATAATLDETVSIDAPAEGKSEGAGYPPRRMYVPPHARKRVDEVPAVEEQASQATPSLSSTAPLPSELPSYESAGTDRFGYSLNQGPRKNMEDAVDCRPQLDGNLPTEFYAVYDGHSGQEAVAFIKRRLPSILCAHEAFGEPTRIKEVLRDVFISVDEELLDSLRQRDLPPLKDAEDDNARTGVNYLLSAGCVACVTVVRGNFISIANLGDCRAVLCRDGDMVPLTEDHHPLENPVEVERLRDLGVEVSGDGYLHSRIAVSRAFGDWAWYAREKCLGLTCVPDVYEAEVTEDTEFMLLACDGIFEKMTTKEAGQIVRRSLRRTRDAKEAAEALVKNAIKMNGTDNLSAIVVVFKLPPGADSSRVAPRFGGFKLSGLGADSETTNS